MVTLCGAWGRFEASVVENMINNAGIFIKSNRVAKESMEDFDKTIVRTLNSSSNDYIVPHFESHRGWIQIKSEI